MIHAEPYYDEYYDEKLRQEEQRATSCSKYFKALCKSTNAIPRGILDFI